VRINAIILLGLAFFGSIAATHADEYPSRNITIISNYPPAGGVDIASRIVGAELQKRLGQSVVVEDKPGATGTIGAGFVAHSAPDGYTILVTANPAITIFPFMTKVNYDPPKDLIPIAKVAIAPTILVVPADSPLHTLKNLPLSSRNSRRRCSARYFQAGW
jgi:tripartite-type tricarboxylate transporter receptor subunit TctC